MVMGNGALAGLVAITAPCSVVYPWGAIVVGIVAGIVYNIGSWVSVKLHVGRCLSPLFPGLAMWHLCFFCNLSSSDHRSTGLEQQLEHCKVMRSHR